MAVRIAYLSIEPCSTHICSQRSVDYQLYFLSSLCANTKIKVFRSVCDSSSYHDMMFKSKDLSTTDFASPGEPNQKKEANIEILTARIYA